MVSKLRRGSVLVLALIAGVMITILVGSMGAYYVHTARMASTYIRERSAPRMRGQMMLEEINQKIKNDLAQIGSSTKAGDTTTISVGSQSDGKTLSQIIEETKNSVNNQNNDYDDGEYKVKINAERIENADKLRVTATVYSEDGEELVVLEEIIEFLSSSTSTLTTIPIFDYVYFANNNGRLNSSYVIANGEIGANGDFLVDGSIVNGYVQVQGEVNLANNPKACPRKTYMETVSSEYSSDFTPVRPTNKMIDSSGNETTWNGGYEPIKATNSFTKPGAAPAAVANPGTAPSEPTITEPSYPDDEPIYVRPDPDPPPSHTITAVSVEESSQVIKWKYNGTLYNTEEAAIKQRQKKYRHIEATTITVYRYYHGSSTSYDDYTSLSDAEDEQSDDNYDVYYWFGWRYHGSKYKSESAAIAAQKKDWRHIEETTATVYRYYKGKSSKYTDYKTEQEAINAQTKDGYNITQVIETSTVTVTKYQYNGKTYDTKAAAESAYQSDYNNYYNTYLPNFNKQCEEDEKEVAEQHDTWEATTLKEYINATNDYANAWSDYKAASEAYAISNSLYNAYLASNATWQAEMDDYNNNINTWQASVDKGLYKQAISDKSETETPMLLIRASNEFDYVSMPVEGNYISDYRGLCQTEKGSLTCANRFKSGSSEKNIAWSRSVDSIEVWQYAYKKGRRTNYPEGYVFGTNILSQSTITRTVSYISVENGYNAEVYPFATRKNDSLKNTGEDSAYSNASLKTAEKGSVILIGTSNYPIQIKGPVWFDGDVVIRGFVSGQGSIYAGRNIHIIGDLTYIDPPNWPNTKDNVSSSLRDEVTESNTSKDILLLVARGNIIIGDYPSTDWQNDCMAYLTMPAGYRSTENSGYATCNDTDIGYGSTFSCDYSDYEYSTSDDNNYKMSVGYKLTNSDLYDNAGLFERLSMLWNTYACNILTYEPEITATTGKRRYYECKLGDEVIAGLMQSSSTDSSTESWRWSSFGIFRWLYRSWGITDTHENHSDSDLDASDASDAIQGDLDAGDITHIDAILYANHGIFGRVGGTASHKFTLNGALLCRDEGLLPSFAARASANGWTSPLPRAWLNWDMRIKSDSSEGLQNVGAKMQERLVSGGVTNRVTSWQQVK